MVKSFISDEIIQELLGNNMNPDSIAIEDILTKARELNGLNFNDVAALLNIKDDENLENLFETANYVKDEIYGSRLVIFAPLYISNFCSNNCLYCGFRADNTDITRHTLSIGDIKEETKAILEQGHKRVLMLMGENHKQASFDFLIDAIEAVYSVSDSKNSSIRRINLEIAPLDDDEFKILSKVKIGTYTVFQETYHRDTYKVMHPSGKKSDYDWRVTTMDRALQNGMHDVGIGALFGLYDYRFDVMGLIMHAHHLETSLGVGPHTISIPRIQGADNAPYSRNIPWAVSDRDFKKLVAIIRCAVPYTGMILSTREPAQLRSDLYKLGISQISAGSKTNIGGYKQLIGLSDSVGQFELNDCRSSGEIINDVIRQGYVPSFCTGCYRLGRVGEDFMEQAKPGLIKTYCLPNGLTTLKEYLIDYADDETRKLGELLISENINNIPIDKVKEITKINLEKIQNGERDIYI